MRRLAGLAAVLGSLVAPPAADARAGGGSFHFGGGGGGGFRGGRFHGIGFFFGGAGLVILLIVVAAVVLVVAYGAWKESQRRARRRERAARVELASAEAAEDDPAFAADAVKESVTRLFAAVQRAWSTNDRQELRALVGGDLLVEWDRRLADFARRGWRNEVSPVSGPEVQYVGLVNRVGTDEDRVVVCLRARLRDVVLDRRGRRILRSDSESDTSSMCEYWTLAREGAGWKVVSVEQEGEGDHVLGEAIVPVPESDEARMRDESLVELAVADAPRGMSPGDLAPLEFEGDARAAALDLSLADPRWAPDVLEAAARRTVAAWAEAVDGPDTALEQVAGPEAVRELLYAGDASGRTRLVVRGPELLGLRITALEPRAEPPRVEVQARLRGRRYVEDRDTAQVLSGSHTRAVEFTEAWALLLDGPESAPWRLGLRPAAVARR